MKEKISCSCLYAVAGAMAAIFAITFLQGYWVGEWTKATWAAFCIIAAASVVCMKTRVEEAQSA